MKEYKVRFVYTTKADEVVRENIQFLANDVEECLDVVSVIGKKLSKAFRDVGVAYIQQEGNKMDLGFNLNYLC